MERHPLPRLSASSLLLCSSLMLCSWGCRTPQSEVPPGKPYQTVGAPPPAIGFSSDPHQDASQGIANLYANRGPGDSVPDGRGSKGRSDDMVYGIPTPGSNNMGAPSDHLYSAPGTSGSTDSNSLANSLLKSMPPVSQELKKDPEATPASTLTGGYP